MMTLPARTRVRLEDYLTLPETNLPMELIDGEVIERATPDALHQDVAGNVFIFLKLAAKLVGGKIYIAPLDVVLDDANVVQPDVLWIAPEGARCGVDETTGRLRGAPDLVVEVLSPTSGYRDRRTKFRLYELHGVREYWLIDPREKLITVWSLRDGRYELLEVYGEGETFASPLVGAVEVNALFSA